MEVWQILLLALVQGLTEFLPVSSSAHLILANRLFGWADQGLAMDVAVHVGSLLAVVGYFRRDLLAMLSGGNSPAFPELPARSLAIWLVLVTVPLVICGVLFADVIGTQLRRIEVIGAASIVFGLVLWLADRWGRRSETRVQPPAMISMGLAQALALIPGTSRSGITMSAGLAAGLDRETASRFAFLMAIPALGSAGLYSAWDLLSSGQDPHLGEFALAVAASAAGAWVCIDAFLRLVGRLGMLPFVIYRVALGVFLLVLAAT
ncbi:MAG: undecaprenyl-diphosphate phosphatase [Pseudomonadota bacterium]